MSGRVPAYRGPVLHFDALRLVALRESGRIEETSHREQEKNDYSRTCALALSSRSPLLLE